MTNKQNPKFQELVAKLREIFQIDRPELDFGIYRILNARAGEINDYLPSPQGAPPAPCNCKLSCKTQRRTPKPWVSAPMPCPRCRNYAPS